MNSYGLDRVISPQKVSGISLGAGQQQPAETRRNENRSQEDSCGGHQLQTDMSGAPKR